MNSRSDW